MAIPRDRGLDSGPAMLREGYEFIGNRCRRFRSDLFETRLMLRRTVCMTGAEAAEVFYHPGRLTRRRSTPPTAVRLLQDYGSVQMLDGAEHHHRKLMFLSLMNDESLDQLARLAEEQWRASLHRWEGMERVVLLDEARLLLCRAAYHWVGLPLPEGDVERMTARLASMIDGAGSVGPRNWRGQLLRQRAERRLRGQVEAVRSGALRVPAGSAAEVVCRHLEMDGTPLTAKAATVELLNLLRPTVAVAQYVVFAALALYRHPETRERLRQEGDEYAEAFAQEVRRYYPFFPFVSGVVMREFEWSGYRFRPGLRVMLDLYGTNRDPRLWERPDEFRPDRFLGRRPSAFDLIPQGGGDHYQGHRCPGEWPTIRLLKEATRFLAGAMSYRVPAQDLSVSLRRMPAVPHSRFVISDVRAVS
jgi:fatty-acid peroxygenase